MCLLRGKTPSENNYENMFCLGIVDVILVKHCKKYSLRDVIERKPCVCVMNLINYRNLGDFFFGSSKLKAHFGLSLIASCLLVRPICL